jgi:hypothetical protein
MMTEGWTAGNSLRRPFDISDTITMIARIRPTRLDESQLMSLSATNTTGGPFKGVLYDVVSLSRVLSAHEIKTLGPN